ncbi:MAG: hypothetical protein JWM98_1126 [Thermoleophilia bacterium]|nr:hypothetical protein [Thermoleophilia bacterium]
MTVSTLPRRAATSLAASPTCRFRTTSVVYGGSSAATIAMDGVLPVTQTMARRRRRAEAEDAAALEDGASCRLWRSFRGRVEPRFVTESERECAELLDFYGIDWEYEPVTFVLETDEEGRVSEAFRPDFYLPELNLFLEVTTMRQELVTKKNRKVRKLRQRYPDVNVRLFYRRDIEALGQKLRSRGASAAPVDRLLAG